MSPGNQALIQLVVSGAVLGGSIGAAIGLLISLISKKGSLDRAFLIDALLGAIGFAGTRIIFALAPIHGETITRHVGNAVVTTTMNRYQYPNRVAFPLAVLLPLLYEYFRQRGAGSRAGEPTSRSA